MEDAREMGVDMRTEVYGLVAACIPQAQRCRLDALPARKRQGLVPDMLTRVQWSAKGPVRDQLLEVKTLHFIPNTYPIRAGRRCMGVARRAEQLPGEYAAKARRVDRDYCGTAGDAVGPVEAKLRSFDEVRGLVFGAWGEVSPSIHVLLTGLADAGASRAPDP